MIEEVGRDREESWWMRRVVVEEKDRGEGEGS